MKLYRTTFYSNNGNVNHSYWKERPEFEESETVNIDVVSKGNVWLDGEEYEAVRFMRDGVEHTMIFDADEGYELD